MRSLPNILKYFMKPKAEDYTLPDTEQMAAQLEEMVRFQESIPQENAQPAENAQGSDFIPMAEPEQPLSDARQDSENAGVSSIAFAKAQASALLHDAQEQAERIIEEAKNAAEAEVAQIHQRAAEEGYGQGYAEGRAKGEQEAIEATKAETQRMVQDVQMFLSKATLSREETIDNLRGELLDVAVTVAEKVIHVSLKSSEEIIKRMILSATQKMKRREWVQIYVADSDVKGVVQTDPTLAAALSSISDHVKIVPMHDAEAGTCIVEMPDEIIDASASTQLENIRAMIRESS